MDWWVWVLVIVGLVLVAWLAWWSSGRTAGTPDHHEGRHPGQLDNRGLS